MALGDEGVEEGLDEGLVVVGELLNLLELAEELAVGEAGLRGLIFGALDEEVGELPVRTG